MKPVTIDFAPRTFNRAIACTGPISWLCIGLGLAVCVSALLVGLKLIEQQKTLEAELLHTEEKLAARTARKPAAAPFKLAATHANAINSAILQLNFPWSAALNAIEAATPSTIALLTLEPDGKKNRIKGMAEANSGEGMVAYIEHLKKQPFFADVELTKHEINEQDPNRPFRFQFEAEIAEDGQ